MYLSLLSPKMVQMDGNYPNTRFETCGELPGACVATSISGVLG